MCDNVLRLTGAALRIHLTIYFSKSLMRAPNPEITPLRQRPCGAACYALFTTSVDLDTVHEISTRRSALLLT